MELIIDTSSDELIAILRVGEKVFEAERLCGKHQETLLPQIDMLFQRANVLPKDVDTYAVVAGPGSFTGIRLAVATVKAFCSVFASKVVAINMLDLLAEKIEVGQAVAIKCTSQKVYLAQKETGGICKSVALCDNLSPLAQKGMLFGYKLKEIEQLKLPQITLTSEDYLKYVDEEIKQNNFVSAQKLEPVYMALSQAEEELLKKEEIQIVPFESKYAEEMFQLQDAVMPSLDKMSRKSFMAEFEEKTRTYFVALCGAVVAGYIGLLSCDKDQNIVSIAVREDLWGQGIGGKLVAHAAQYAKSIDCKTLSLEVDEKNTRALNFYKKLGFEVTNIRKKYYKDNDALVMFLKI